MFLNGVKFVKSVRVLYLIINETVAILTLIHS